MRRLPATVVVSVVGLAAATAVPAAGAAAPEDAWSPTVNVTDVEPAITTPGVAIDAAGRGWAAWVQGTGRRSAVFTAIRREDNTWTIPYRMPGTRAAVEARLVTADNGARVLVWSTRRAVKTVRQLPGREWSSPVVLRRTPEGRFPSTLQVDVNPDGVSTVAWQVAHVDQPGGDTVTRVQAVTGAGRAWTRARTLSGGDAPAGAPEVAIDRTGRAVVVWNELRDKRWHVMAASRSPESRWTAPRALDDGTGQPGSPQVAGSAGGQVAVAWSAAGRSPAIEIARWRPRRGWTEPVEVPGVRTSTWWHDLGTDDRGNVTVVWTNRAKSLWSATQTGAGRWTRERVAPAGSVYYVPRLSVSGLGDAVVGWESLSGGDHPVMAAYRARGAEWGAPVRLSSARGDSFGPAVAAGDGVAVAAWSFTRDIAARTARVQARWLPAAPR